MHAPDGVGPHPACCACWMALLASSLFPTGPCAPTPLPVAFAAPFACYRLNSEATAGSPNMASNAFALLGLDDDAADVDVNAIASKAPVAAKAAPVAAAEPGERALPR